VAAGPNGQIVAVGYAMGTGVTLPASCGGMDALLIRLTD